jgi:BASS family bile acid:Na+ symporter
MTLQQSILLAVQASILMMVFGFGLQTTPGDVLDVVRRPSLLGRSLVAMFVIMPIIAFTLDRLFALHPAVEIALLALSISPIPPLLPAKEQKAGGYFSYALGLLAIVGALSIVIVPAAVHLLGRYSVRPLAMAPSAVAGAVLLSVLLPLAAGLAFRAIVPALAVRIEKPIGLIAKVLLVFGLIAILASVLPAVLALLGNGTIAAFVVFAVAGLAVGHWLGGPEDGHRLVLALSTASRHPAIALAVAKANFPDEPYLTASILLYLLVNALVGIPFLAWRKRRMSQ